MNLNAINKLKDFGSILCSIMEILSSDSGERPPSECGSSETLFASFSHDPERILVLDVNSDSEASVSVPSVIDEADCFFSISDTEAEVTLGESMQEESQSTRDDFIEIFSRPRLIPALSPCTFA